MVRRQARELFAEDIANSPANHTGAPSQKSSNGSKCPLQLSDLFQSFPLLSAFRPDAEREALLSAS